MRAEQGFLIEEDGWANFDESRIDGRTVSLDTARETD